MILLYLPNQEVIEVNFRRGFEILVEALLHPAYHSLKIHNLTFCFLRLTFCFLRITFCFLRHTSVSYSGSNSNSPSLVTYLYHEPVQRFIFIKLKHNTCTVMNTFVVPSAALSSVLLRLELQILLYILTTLLMYSILQILFVHT